MTDQWPSPLTNYRYNLHVEEIEERLNGHVDADSIGDEEGQGTRWLRNNHDSVDDCVDNSGDGSDTDQHNGQTSRRIGQHVQESNENERDHILQVVQMRPTHSLHVRVIKLNLQFLRWQILGISECLELTTKIIVENCGGIEIIVLHNETNPPSHDD